MADDHWYLNDEGLATRGFAFNLIYIFLVWFVAMINLVPISLLVTLEMVKFFQAYFISNDWRIYDETKDMETRV